MLRWLMHIGGLDNPGGAWYLWWSGVGADLGMLAAVVAFWRRHVCHVAGCVRFTKPPHPVCRKHADVSR